MGGFEIALFASQKRTRFAFERFSSEAISIVNFHFFYLIEFYACTKRHLVNADGYAIFLLISLILHRDAKQIVCTSPTPSTFVRQQERAEMSTARRLQMSS